MYTYKQEGLGRTNHLFSFDMTWTTQKMACPMHVFNAMGTHSLSRWLAIIGGFQQVGGDTQTARWSHKLPSIFFLNNGINPSQGRYLHRTTQIQKKRRQTCMPWVGFEPTTPVFERVKTVHVLDCTATVIGTSTVLRIYLSVPQSAIRYVHGYFAVL
jgi:hypothetical protein